MKDNTNTFGMIKPEGMKHLDDILQRIEDAGLKVERCKRTFLTEEQFELIYGHARKNIPRVYDALKDYMTSKMVMILQINGNNAQAKLMQLRGASNANEAEPGTIRGDYASDQDYNRLYREGKFAKNVFHATDADDAESMVEYFFGGRK